MRRSWLAAVIMLCCGCGLLGGDPGGGSRNLPVSGGGAFRPLPRDPDLEINAPFVLLDNLADLDDPSVLAEGDALALWLTARRRMGAATVTRIEHADAPALTRGFGELQVALEASQPWEGGAVSAPSVLRDAPWLLFYAAGGAIGYAVGQDELGHRWQKVKGPALIANTLEEGMVLDSPAVVRLADRLRLFYLANGAVWAAEAPFAGVAAGDAVEWTRLDADPSTPVRDPVLADPSTPPRGAPRAGVPYAVGLGRISARATLTPGGRLRHDLYFTARTATEAMSTVGFATTHEPAPFDLSLLVAPAPILPVKQTTRAPAMTPYRDGAILLYVQRLGSRDSIAAGISP